MRILLICPVFPPEPAPAGVMTRELAEDLVAAGHEVDVITAFPSQPLARLYDGYRRRLVQVEPHGGYRLFRIWHTVPDKTRHLSRLAWWATFGLSSAWQILRLRRYDVCYAHPTAFLGSLATLWATRIKKIAYVYGIFDIYPEIIAEVGMISPRSPVYRVARALDTWICRRAERIATLSEGMRRTLAERGLSPQQIAVFPFWLDENELRPLERDNAWRREQGIGPEKFVVLYAGTIGNISGAEIIADVAEKLRGEKDLLFLLVGEGVAKQAVRARAEQLGLSNIRFLPFQPRERLAEVQSAADMGVITLKHGAGKNSLPSKMLGYLSCGRGVLASVDEDSDTARVIRDGACGLVSPAEDADAFAAAVREAMHPGAAERFGRASRELFCRRYARSTVTAEYERLLTDVARQWPGRPIQRGGRRVCTTAKGREIPLPPPRPAKRAMDFLLALLGLIVSAPIWLTAALLVKLTSRGPVFYRDARLGRGGRHFRMLKFRSMRVDAPEMRSADGKLVVADQDPRITPVGRWLRKLKIDEIPQWFNVLFGDMSMVGPRPFRPTGEDEIAAGGLEMLQIRPGVTGLASIIGGRQFTVPTLIDVARCYARHQSIWLDLKIMLYTPVYIFRGAEATRHLLRRYIDGCDLAEVSADADR